MSRVFLVVWAMDRFGGMERHVVELACALDRAGIEVTVFSEQPVSGSNAYVKRLRQAGIAVVAPPRYLDKLNRTRQDFCRATKGKYLLYNTSDEISRLIEGDWLSGWLAGAIKKRIKGSSSRTIVHVHGSRLGQTWLLRWAELQGIPSIYTEHVCVTQYGGPHDRNAPELVMHASVLTCVSDEARRDLMSLLPKPKPVSVVGHIVPDVEENERKSADLTIACLSRLEAYKGIEVLLRAFARVRRGKLILAGDGSLRGPLEALAGELDLNGSVEFRGALAPDDAAAVLRSATVLAIPSVAEGTPLALLEGMAAGKPIVATRVGGIPDTIRDEESGLLVDPGNVEQLAEALDRAISGEELRRSLGAGARAAFEQCQHTERAGVNAALALYNQASGGFADSRRSTVITPEWRSGSAGLSEVWEYRDLLYLMVVRDLKLRYQQATVGVAWVVLQPLLIMLVLTGFAALTGVKTGAVPYPLFAVSGLVPWTYFVHAFTTATYSLVSHSDLLGKIYFPRLIVPLSTTLAGAVDFLVAASLLPFFMLYYGAAPTPALLALPLCVVFALAAALALGLWLAVLNLRYSDVGNAIPFFTQLLFFTTPIAYPANLAPEPWRTVLGLNPMVGVVEAFRWSLLGTARAPMHQSALVSLAVVVILLAGAIRYFRGRESEFADRL